MGMTWHARIANYEQETGFPRSLFVAADGRVVGTWIIGNDYRTKKQPDGTDFYGAYPHGFLRRVSALFPEREHVLHLFSGNVDLSEMPGETVDLDPAQCPMYVDDAQTLESVPLERYDLCVCDPPYSVEDAEHYEPTMVKRNKVMRALGVRLRPGTFVAWLDQTLPMWRKDQFDLEAAIGVMRSTNHRFRMLTIFKRK